MLKSGGCFEGRRVGAPEGPVAFSISEFNPINNIGEAGPTHYSLKNNLGAKEVGLLFSG